jgi:hypothetical protein
MKTLFILLFTGLLVTPSYSNDRAALPEITQKSIEAQERESKNLVKDLEKFNLEFLDSSNLRGFDKKAFVDYLISFVEKRIFPKHLRDYDPRIIANNLDKDIFLNYKGISGGCYQFRLFHKYQDETVSDFKWASSILTLPPKNSTKEGVGSSVVLAPSLDGTTMLIEGGMWRKLCKKGVASLTPESSYKRWWFGLWKKELFDPTPEIKDPLDFGLYQEYIDRYERLLVKNLEILRNFSDLKTNLGEKVTELSVAELSPNRVGYWGSSFGAILGSMIVGKDKTIKASVLTVGGGNIPFIVSESDIDLFKNTRAIQMNHLSLNSKESYQYYLAQHIDQDPLDLVSSEDRDRAYLILATKDKLVPTVSQMDLYEQMGKPRASYIPSGHVLTLITTSWVNPITANKGIDFLIDRLVEPQIGTQSPL